MAGTTGQPGWSFTTQPVKDPGSGQVTFAFQGPATSHTIEARLYGLKGGDTSKGYFADFDTYSPYDGAVTAATEVFTQANDAIYAVIVYDVTAGREVLAYRAFDNWFVSDRTAKTSESGTARPLQNPMTITGSTVLSIEAKHVWGDDDRLYIPDTTTDDAPSNVERARMRYGRERRKIRAYVAFVGGAYPDVSLPHRVISKGYLVNRRWGGIGGFQYIPSFPQLNRFNTTWPLAK